MKKSRFHHQISKFSLDKGYYWSLKILADFFNNVVWIFEVTYI